ncbi:hypothetical protein MAHJHV33_49730 [Mycobacterium avium subsp. hominissuis]
MAAAFGTHAGVYQATQAIGEVVHQMFVSTMGISSADYAATEVANAATMI